jgi:hypothetical protein
MSLYTSLFGGTSVKTMPADPTMEGWQNQLFNYNPGKGYLGREAKGLLSRLSSGEDVSSEGALSSIAQQHAANRRDISDNASYGANALIAQSGGENANILNRQKEMSLDRDYERQGQEYTQGILGLRDQAASQLEHARDTGIQARLSAMQGALGSRGNYYNSRYRLAEQKGLFPTLSEMAKNGAMAAAA